MKQAQDKLDREENARECKRKFLERKAEAENKGPPTPTLSSSSDP